LDAKTTRETETTGREMVPLSLWRVAEEARCDKGEKRKEQKRKSVATRRTCCFSLLRRRNVSW